MNKRAYVFFSIMFGTPEIWADDHIEYRVLA